MASSLESWGCCRRWGRWRGRRAPGKGALADALVQPKGHEASLDTSPAGRLFVFIVYTQVVQALMSYDGGATQFCTSALAKSGWSPLWLGLLGAMDKFGQVATAFLWGEALMRHDAKPLLVAGLFWKAACCLLFGKLQEQPVTPPMQLAMLSAKLGMGASEALVSVWATVWVQRNAPSDARARWLGFAGTSAGIGSGVGSGVASLWSPIYAFFLQAFVLFGIWAMLLLTPASMLRLGHGSTVDNMVDPESEMATPSPQYPGRMLVQQVGRSYMVPPNFAAQEGVVVAVQSVRLPEHFLDASVDPLDHGFKARITKGNLGEWAHFRMRPAPGGEQLVTLESLRLPGHFLDASGERLSMLDTRLKVRISEGDPSNIWAQFRLHKMEDHVVCFESLRLPGHYLNATGERHYWGTRVCMTRGDPAEGDWAKFVVHDVHVPQVPDGAVSRQSSMPGQGGEGLGGRFFLVVGNHLWLWTAMCISLNCFVTSGISFLWQNTVENVWGFDNAWSFGFFLFSTGVGGMVGVIVGPQMFDSHLGGFALPKGKAECLLWAKRATLAAALCSTVCTVLLVEKACHLVSTNETASAPAWQLAVLVACVFAIFFFVNSITGALYGINTEAVSVETRTFAAGMTVTFQNVFGYACGPLLPSAFAELVGRTVKDVWPQFPWDKRAVDGAKFAAGMSLALASAWALFAFARLASHSARVAHISQRSLHGVASRASLESG